MGKKQLMLLVGLMLALSVFLAACTGKDDGNTAGEKDKDKDKVTEEGKESGEKAELDFPLNVSNTGAVVEDGELNYALVVDTPFEGTLNKVFYSGKPDFDVMQFFEENLLATDGDYIITNEGAADFKLGEDNKSITLTIKDGVKWHDGEDVKASDLLYAYQLLGHPDYLGTRYTFTISNVVGMPEYHEGKTDQISGIEVSKDDKSITINYEIASPSILSGVWTAAVPRHHVGDVVTGEVTMDDLVASDKIRVNPIGFGPYKVSKIVPGESVQYERFDDYWRGEPALKSVVLKVVNTKSIVKAVEAGDIDLAEIPADQYLNVKDLGNIELLAKVDLAYTYIGFKLGKWDGKKEENITDPDAKLADKRVRQAMWHAMDNDVIGKEMYHGLRFPATTLIIPVFESYHDESNPGRGYDPEKANALLDEAGFLDVTGDGIREDADGNEFVLNFASMEGGEVAEPIAEWYIQNWEAVGIKVQLTDGRLHEFNSFYDMVEADDPKIDIYQAAWGTGSDPDPEGLYGRTAEFNYTRFASEENDRLLAEGTSEKSFDLEYRKGIYNEWQELMVEEVPVAPTVYRYALTAVNNRVANYSIDPGSDLWLYEMGVTDSVPAK